MVVAWRHPRHPLQLLFLLALSASSRAETLAAVSLWMPAGVQSVELQVRPGAAARPVRLVDDGSLCFDRPLDGEWWALVAVADPSAPVELVFAGSVDGVALLSQQSVLLPLPAGDGPAVVGFRVVPEEGGVGLRPIGAAASGAQGAATP